QLFVNCLALYLVGRLLENMVGTKNLIVIYFLSGITACLCSFALDKGISISSSGSLMGLVFCLFMMMKYEEKISAELGVKLKESNLQQIFLAFIVLVSIPALSLVFIDIPTLLGGALAGSLLGMSFIFIQKWNLRIIFSAKFLVKPQERLKRRFFEFPKLYYLVLLLFNIVFSLHYFKISENEKLISAGIQLGIEENTNKLNANDLVQYQYLLVVSNKETNPNILFAGILQLHEQGYFEAAIRGYEVLKIFYQAKLGDEHFQSESSKALLAHAMQAALKFQKLSQERVVYLSLLPKTPLVGGDICEKPADLLMTLGFFELARLLYQCASEVENSKSQLIIKLAKAAFLTSSEEQ
ncbi:MAG: rhomboid family intramembrane serine protease, partial [Silvanigrellaceae bacterium]|nr:rhomboid family intramembrane serine protease [Silvanigrellaceae bacterium]